MKKIILFALILLSGYYSSAQEEADAVDDEIFTNVEVLPEFPGGTQAWGRFLMRNLRYPHEAMENNISGKVTVQFVVEKDGSLTDIKVIQGNGGECDEEAVRVIKLSPAWRPGIQNGRLVRTFHSVPFVFQLSTGK